MRLREVRLRQVQLFERNYRLAIFDDNIIQLLDLWLVLQAFETGPRLTFEGTTLLLCLSLKRE